MTAPAPDGDRYDELRFVEHHRPGLEAGDYDVSVSQVLTQLAPKPFPAAESLAVMGERFSLNPGRVQSVYPPAGGRGDYWNVLPHIVFNRPTLPWERSACDEEHFDKDHRPPWLALLIFDQDEMAAVMRSVHPLEGLTDAAVSDPAWPGISEESGQHGDDQVVVIDVPWSTLTDLLPQGLDDFALRTHCRRAIPPELRVRIQERPRSMDKLIEALDRRWTAGLLTEVFAADGIALGDPEAVEWTEGRGHYSWQFFDSTGGLYEAAPGHGPDSGWVHFVGGPVAETGAVDTRRHHDLVALDADISLWREALDHDHAPPSLVALLTSCQINVHEPTVVTVTEQRRWRVSDESIGVHLLIEAPDDGTLEIKMYEAATSESAVVIANRLPTPGRRCFAHLVSFEDRFQRVDDDVTFPAPSGQDVRLVSLHSWDFFCVDGLANFGALLQNLNGGADVGTPPQFGLPSVPGAAGDRLVSGSVPLRHHLRRGDRTVSWYHGPLLARALSAPAIDEALPATVADELIVFDTETGLFDVSFATAWELGRMLTLANTAIATKLFAWKRRHAHDLAAARHVADFGYHLPLKNAAPPDLAGANSRMLPPEVERWFSELSLLRPVPFRNLVPDERLLPAESIRFFTVDAHWLACLHDGAFSVGRVSSTEVERDRADLERLPKPRRESVSGFLLRSEVVSAFPDFGITAYGKAPGQQDADLNEGDLDPALFPPLEVLRFERLSPSVLLVMVRGDLRMVDIHQAHEAMHFGLDVGHITEADALRRDPQDLLKSLRRADGVQIDDTVGPGPVGNRRTLDFAMLATTMRTKLAHLAPKSYLAEGGIDVAADELNPAVFALEMITAPELVRFIRGSR